MDRLAGGGGQAGGEPNITSVIPDAGPRSGGTPIMILGKDFAVGATVTIGGVPANNVVVVEDSRITAVVPANSLSGPVDVVVRALEGDDGLRPELAHDRDLLACFQLD